mmetsp:Transcript_29676/g.81707  ORF Transcript_29676/g.81707 Transcript_29676/m.81707 type:complete len:158 (-) Transcript_29676:73-546(-)
MPPALIRSLSTASCGSAFAAALFAVAMAACLSLLSRVAQVLLASACLLTVPPILCAIAFLGADSAVPAEQRQEQQRQQEQEQPRQTEQEQEQKPAIRFCEFWAHGGCWAGASCLFVHGFPDTNTADSAGQRDSRHGRKSVRVLNARCAAKKSTSPDS